MMKLSIILPCYNVEKYIEHCLDTLLLQNLESSQYEIICINDGSNDKTIDVILKYSNKYSNVIVVDKTNTGVSDCRNIGLKKAKGKYIWFFDSDDFCATNCIKALIDTLEKTLVDCLVFARELADEDDNGFYVFKTASKIIVENNYKEIFEATSCRTVRKDGLGFRYSVWRCIYKRDFLLSNNIFFEKSLKHYEDMVFNYLCRKHMKSVCYYDSTVYFYRKNPKSVSNERNDLRFYNIFLSCLKIVEIFSNESTRLKEGYEKEEKEYLNEKKTEFANNAYEILYNINDSLLIKNCLNQLKSYKRIIFRGNRCSKMRKIINVISKFVPFNVLFFIMRFSNKIRKKQNIKNG